MAQYEIDLESSREAWEALYRAIEASAVPSPPPAAVQLARHSTPHPVAIEQRPELDMDAAVALWLGGALGA